MDYVNRMADEFLKWRLPEDFVPDAGVVFTKPPNWHWWPTGTNLLTAVQTRAMFEHCAKSLLDDLARKDSDCHANGARVIELEAELARVWEADRRCRNSVVECIVRYPNVGEYIAQLEQQRDAAIADKERVARRAYDYGYREGQLQLARHEDEAVAQAMRENNHGA